MTAALESTEPVSSPSDSNVVVGFNPRKLIELYFGGRFDDLSEELLGVLAHSVYRNYAHYVRGLREKFHLTFFQLGRLGLSVDESLFDEVRLIAVRSSSATRSGLAHLSFVVGSVSQRKIQLS
jgi:hypothetical protein